MNLHAPYGLLARRVFGNAIAGVFLFAVALLLPSTCCAWSLSRVGEQASNSSPSPASNVRQLTLSAGALYSIAVYHQEAALSVSLIDPQGHVIARIQSHHISPTYVAGIAPTSGAYTIAVEYDASESSTSPYRVLVQEGGSVRHGGERALEGFHFLQQGDESAAQWKAQLLDKAAGQYTEASDIFGAIHDYRDQAEALLRLARVLEIRSSAARTLAAYKSVEAIGAAHQLRTAELLGRLGFVSVLVSIGHNREASSSLEDLLSRSDLREDPDLLARALMYRAALESYRSDVDDAERDVDEALHDWESTPNNRQKAIALTFKGYIQATRLEYRDAIEVMDSARRLASDVGDPRQEALALHNLGNFYLHNGAYGSALNAYSQALELFTVMGDEHERGYVLDGLGHLTLQLNKPGASGLFRQAADEGARYGDDFLEMSSTSDLTQVLRDRGMPREALPYCELEIRHSRSLENPVFTVLAFRDTGETYLKMGRMDTAIQYFEKALEPQWILTNVAEQADTRMELAQAFEQAKNPAAAMASYDQAAALAHSVQYLTTEANALYHSALLDVAFGKKAEALAKVEQSIDLAEHFRARSGSEDARAFWFGTVHQFYELQVDLLMGQSDPLSDGDVRRAFDASENSRSRTLVELLRESNVNLNLGMDSALVRKKEQLDQFIADLSQEEVALLNRKRAGSEMPGLVSRLASASRLDNDVRREILARYPKYSELETSFGTISSEKAQGLLDPDDLLIEYQLGEDGGYAWALTATDISYFRLPKAEVLTSLAREFIARTSGSSCNRGSACANDSDPRFITLSEELGAILLGPVEKKLTHHRLIFVNDGILQYLPFSALADPESPRTASEETNNLMNSHEIVYLPSASALWAIRSRNRTVRPSEERVAVFADPVFESDDPRIHTMRHKVPESLSSQTQAIEAVTRDIVSFRNGIPRLPGTRREATEIAAVAKQNNVQLNLDFDASLRRLTEREVATASILHFATHSILDSKHPESSGIVLSLFRKDGTSQDGYLGLKGIYGLHLNAKLVVLSACDTALGRDIHGEGIIGLTRGFLYAGAPSVVATLWKVDDQATSAFMKLFYGALLNEKESPASALREAQRAMRRQTRWRSPYYWSGFALIGDWRP